MKKLLSLVLMSAMILSIVGCGTSKKTEQESAVQTETVEDSATEAASEPANEDTGVAEDLLSGMYYVCIDVENYGSIIVELDADTAPITVTNFMNLVKSGFYDGLTFHRIIDGFMIQGGDPLGNGTGGSGKNIIGEFAANGIENNISHTRGVISMARSQNNDSASSQFFIVHEDSDFLDGQYAAFGYVVNGMEIVDQICKDTPVLDSNGTVAPENQPKIISISDMTAEHDFAVSDEFMPSNALEVACGKGEFESYDEVIDNMLEGMGYSYVDVYGSDSPILLIADEIYDDGNGNNVAITTSAYVTRKDGTVVCSTSILSYDTAYPLVVTKDGLIMGAGEHEVDANAIASDTDDTAIMCMASLFEEYNDGNASYSGFYRNENLLMNESDVWIEADDSSTYQKYYDMYNSADKIIFTKK